MTELKCSGYFLSASVKAGRETSDRKRHLEKIRTLSELLPPPRALTACFGYARDNESLPAR